MKKYNLILLCLLAVVVSSCNDFLDIKPVGKVIPTNVDEYRALLARAYQTTPSDRGDVSFRADEMEVVDVSYEKNSYGYLEIWDDASTLNSKKEFSWKQFYTIIYTANQVIENHSKIELVANATQADIDQLVGEAYLLRAYMHYLLVNLYGLPYTMEGGATSKAVPLVLDSDIEKVRGRDQVGTIYNAIVSDIASARKLVNRERWESSFSYRFNRTSVDAFDARISLYMGKWEQAYKAAKNVIDAGYVLVDFNTENVIAPNHYTSSENIVAFEPVISLNVSKASRLSAIAKKWYGKDDKRMSVYFKELENKNPKPEDKPKDIQTIKGGAMEYKTTFRLGEFVLTAAEAAAQLGKVDEAKAYINQLAAKRYTTDGAKRVEQELQSLKGADLLEYIYLERARELAFEGHRWFDLRRTTRPEIVKVIGDKTYTLNKDDARYAMPIPKEATSANPNLLN